MTDKDFCLDDVERVGENRASKSGGSGAKAPAFPFPNSPVQRMLILKRSGLGKLFLVGALAFVALQLVRPSIPRGPSGTEIAVPPDVQHVLSKSCSSCHSDQTQLAWFDQVVPAYWLVRRDVLTARAHLNFSTMGAQPAGAQRAKLFEAVNMMQLGAMPLPQFTALHPEARITTQDLDTLKAYLKPWPALPQETSVVQPLAAIAADAVRPEWNHLAFDTPADWKLITVTDRGDNNTFRFVLGNPVAMQAIAAGRISPWPDGTKFAKIAWKQQAGLDGIVRPGAFVQIELMVKDAQRFKSTDGWGWGRWLGHDLRPYGNDARFTNECTGCHLPVRGDDYVYTLPIAAIRLDRSEIVNNGAAALPPALPFQPLGWKPLTLFVDPKTLAISTLLVNEEGARGVQAWLAHGSQSAIDYPAGSVLALVTWGEREDPHWFGARIPDLPQSVEFVRIHEEGRPATYQRFAGSSLNEQSVDEATASERVHAMQSLAPAVLPW